MKLLLRMFRICKFMIILYTNLIIDLFKTVYYIVNVINILIKMNLVIKIYSLSLYNSMIVI